MTPEVHPMKATLRTKAAWHLKDLTSLGLAYQARHLHRRDRSEFRVRIKEVGDMTLRPRTADAAVVSQVFSWRQYDLSQFPQQSQISRTHDEILERGRRPLILDLGANNGASARWFARAYPQADIVAVSQVFSWRQYDLSQFPQQSQISRTHDEILERGRRPLILDLGANNGASARWFARAYPQADIVAVEPDPENARICRVNTSGHAVQVLTAAIGGVPGTVTLHNTDTATLSYTTTRAPDGAVPVVTVGQILADRPDHELFIVKIDIEGFEEDLFAADTDWVEQATVLLVEPHDWKFPERDTSHNLQQTMGRLPFHLLLCGENLVYVRHGHRAVTP